MITQTGGSVTLRGKQFRPSYPRAEKIKNHCDFEFRGMDTVIIDDCHGIVDVHSNDGRVAGLVRVVGAENVIITNCTWQGATHRPVYDLRHCRNIFIDELSSDSRGGFGGPLLAMKAGPETGAISDHVYARPPGLWTVNNLSAQHMHGRPEMCKGDNLDVVLVHSPNVLTMRHTFFWDIGDEAVDASLDMGMKPSDFEFDRAIVELTDLSAHGAARIKITGKASVNLDQDEVDEIKMRHMFRLMEAYLNETRLETYYGADTACEILHSKLKHTTSSPIKLGTGTNAQLGPMIIHPSVDFETGNGVKVRRVNCDPSLVIWPEQ